MRKEVKGEVKELSCILAEKRRWSSSLPIYYHHTPPDIGLLDNCLRLIRSCYADSDSPTSILVPQPTPPTRGPEIAAHRR